MSVFCWVRRGGSSSRLSSSSSSFLTIGGPANLSVIVWPLSACLLQSAVLQQPSPHPPLARLPADPPNRLASLLFLLHKSSSFRTGPSPPVLDLLLLLRQSLSVLGNLHFHSLLLSPARITLVRDGVVGCVLTLFLFPGLYFCGIASVFFFFLFCCHDKFADVVAVLIDDVVYDCL